MQTELLLVLAAIGSLTHHESTWTRIMWIGYSLGAKKDWNPRLTQHSDGTSRENDGACSNCIVNFFIESECQPDDSSIAVDDDTFRLTMYKSAENFNGIRSHQRNIRARRTECAELFLQSPTTGAMRKK